MDTVVDRLIRYAKVYSESDYHAGRTVTPSTDRQFDMAKLLVEELHGLGIENARYDDKCYVYATLDATPGCEQLPAIGLIAHMDTTPDMTGKDVKPQIIHYTGGDVVLNREQNIVMEAAQFPELQKFVGQELVCTDGTTLLGADDKAGIAIILQAVEELLLKFKNLDKECRHLGIYSPVDSVTGRLKTPASILDKAGRKHIAPDHIEEEIEDIAGIRILCQFVEDIQKVVDMVRSRTDMTIVQEKDYITNTKASGYRSYHIIIRYPLSTALGPKEVFAEIQIRTNAMNFWATAEHSLRYKYSGNIPQELQDRLHNCAEAAFHLDQEMSTIREEITNAQRLNEIRRKMTSNILDNIRKLHFMLSLEDMSAINKEFSDVWNSNDIDKLREFNERLNVLVEVYRI